MTQKARRQQVICILRGSSADLVPLCDNLSWLCTASAAKESFARLHRAGWSVGDVRNITAEGSAWCVCGTNGENAVNARGATQAEAAGMLRRRPSTPRA